MKQIIDVPYYSEFDRIDGSAEHIKTFKRRSCGIVSVKMVVDYFVEKDSLPKVTLNELIKKALHHHAYRLELGGTRKNFGWVHSGIVRTLQEFGFKAWRRKFTIMTLREDLLNLKKEGLSIDSLAFYKKQITEDAFSRFVKNIDEERPFLVSMVKNLGKKDTPHLVVVTGYEKTPQGRIKGFFVNDPNNPKKNGKRPKHKDYFIPVEEFEKNWRRTAIFLEV